MVFDWIRLRGPDPYALALKIERDIAKMVGNYAIQLYSEYTKNFDENIKKNADTLLALAEDCIRKAGRYKLLRRLKI